MVYRYGEHIPQIHESVFLAPGTEVIGDVHLGAESSVWFGTVLRGDVNHIRVGARTNIQDQTMVHVSSATWPTLIGADVTIGHQAMLHGCTIADRVLVGMRAVLLDGCEIGEDCLVGAGSVVLEGTKIPPRSLVVGYPAKVKRPLSDDEVARIQKSAVHYAALAATYREGALRPIDGPGQPGRGV